MSDPRNCHREAEERSLALHREVARRIVEQPELIDEVRARVADWLRQGSRPYAEAWQRILQGSVESIARAIVDESEHARDLRQSTPFAGVLDAPTRWRILEKLYPREAAPTRVVTTGMGGVLPGVDLDRGADLVDADDVAVGSLDKTGR